MPALSSRRAIFSYFAEISREPRSNEQRLAEQKPSRPTIILFLSTFPLFSPAALLRGRSSLSRPRRDEEGEEMRDLLSGLQPRFLRLLDFVFTKRRRRPWANVREPGSMNWYKPLFFRRDRWNDFWRSRYLPRRLIRTEAQ